MTAQKTKYTPLIPRLVRATTLMISLLALFGSVVGSERAEAATAPAHQVGAWFYDNYGLGVYPPKYMNPSYPTNCYNGEQVKWSPDLYRWNGSSWVLYNGSAPWYGALTGSSGYCYMQAFYGYWWNTQTYSSLQFHRFGKLPAGYYKIRHYMYWKGSGTYYKDSDWFHVY